MQFFAKEQGTTCRYPAWVESCFTQGLRTGLGYRRPGTPCLFNGNSGRRPAPTLLTTTPIAFAEDGRPDSGDTAFDARPTFGTAGHHFPSPIKSFGLHRSASANRPTGCGGSRESNLNRRPDQHMRG